MLGRLCTSNLDLVVMLCYELEVESRNAILLVLNDGFDFDWLE